MSTDPTAGTTGQAAQASTETWCERFPNEGHAWSYTHHAGPARIETRTCTLCGYLSVEPIAARFASLTSENARLRQQRNEAREERDATVELAQTQLEGWRKTRAERDDLRHQWLRAMEQIESWVGSYNRLADDLAALIADSHPHEVVVSAADVERELRAALTAPSATETAPQTPPGVTGHTEAPTAPSEPLRRPCGCPDNRTGYALLAPSSEPHQPGCPLRGETAAEALEGVAAGSKLIREALAEREAHNPPPSGEGAALIAATEQEVADLGDEDPAGVEQLVGQRDVWRETAQTLARKVDERPTTDSREDEYARMLAKLDREDGNLRADLATLKQPTTQPEGEKP